MTKPVIVDDAEEPARLDEIVLSPAAERLAALLALPLRAEPETPDEAAMFEQAERSPRQGG